MVLLTPHCMMAIMVWAGVAIGYVHAASSPSTKMPSLFRNEDMMYDRYAACLAATEGLRRRRDRSFAQVSEEKNSKQLMAKIEADYAKDATKILEGLGMSLNKFNKIGQSVISNKVLKRKVVSQAYLYRVESAVHMDRIPIDNPSASFPDIPGGDEKLKSFCQSMVQIETLRQVQLEKLRASANLGRMPQEGALTSILPLMRPNIRQFVSEFPVVAEDIVKQNGLDATEFNAMLWQTKRNPKMQRKVQRIVSKLR